MKISFLIDQTLELHKGGAELNCRKLVELGREKGHEVLEITDGTKFKKSKIKGSDVVILVNIRSFKKDDIIWIINNFKSFKLEMDYGFCETKNCSCFAKEDLIKKCNKCNSELYNFYEKLIKNTTFIFLSPRHKEIFETFFGKIDNSFLYIPFYSDEKLYYDYKVTRIKNSVLWAGRMTPSKGVYNIIHKAIDNPQFEFFFAGKCEFPMVFRNISNCTYLGDIDFKTMPLLFNLMEIFIYEGNWPDTGPVTVLEALLCGCKLSTNKEVATILSNDFTTSTDLRKLINDSKEEFWKKIEGI